MSKRMKNDKYMDFLAGSKNSIFEDFECYLRTEDYFVEHDI